MASPPTPKPGENVTTEPRFRQPIRGIDVLVNALHMNYGQIKKADEMRLAKIMRKLGYIRVTGRHNGVLAKLWINPVTVSGNNFSQ